MNRINICKNIIQSIHDYITNQDNLDAYREKNRFVRKRKLSIFQVIMYLLFTSKASMYQNLFRIRTELNKLEFPDVSKQALSKARQSIHPDLFLSLFNISVDLFYSQLPQRRTWNGYHLLAVDGSKLELPNSKSNFEFFGEMFTYPNPERRFTSGLASIIYDVLDDYIVHASLNPYLTSERTVAKEHIANLEALEIFTDNSIVIFDRGYYSEGMFRFFSERNHLCLMRLKTNTKVAKNCKGKGDTLSILPGDPKLGTEDVKIRVVEVKLPNGTEEYLATNIFDPGITPSMFRELYFYRWPIEVKYSTESSKPVCALKNFQETVPSRSCRNSISTFFFQTLHRLSKTRLTIICKSLQKAPISTDINRTGHLSSVVSKDYFQRSYAPFLKWPVSMNYTQNRYEPKER